MSKYITEDEHLDKVVMTGEEMMAATTTAVRAISDDFDTGVVFQGEGAFTDGKDISLPVIPLNAPVTKRDALVVGGYANHEGLHKLLTDFAGLKEKMERWHVEGKTLTKQLANGMEDGRIEHGGTVLYGGLSGAIDKTARHVNRTFIDTVYPKNPSVVEDFGRIGPVAVTWESRRRIGYPDPSNEECLALLPPKMLKKIRKIVDRLMKVPHGVTGLGKINRRVALKGSRDVAAMAEKIANEYMKEKQDEEDQQQQQQQQGQGQGGDASGNQGEDKTANTEQPGELGNPGDNQTTKPDEGDGDDDSGDGQGASSNEEGNEQGDGDASANDGKDDGEQTTPDNEHGAGDTGEQTPENDGSYGATTSTTERVKLSEPLPIDPSLKQAITQTIKKIAGDTDKPYTVMLPDEDIFITRRKLGERPDVKTNGSRWYKDDKAKINSSVGTTRRKLERVLTALARTDIQNNKRNGKLDVRSNVAKIVNYKTNVFRRKEEEANVNSALSILVDLSASMTTSGKINLAGQVTLAIAEALDIVGVPLEVLGHNTKADWRRKGKKAQICLGSYGRRCSIVMKQFKEFDDPLSLCRPTLGTLSRSAGGSNADGDAILFAAKRLMQRTEPKKFLFVLSDGQPAYASDTRCTEQYTRDAVEWCIFRGVRVMGLGMMDQSVRKYYPEYVIVNDMEQFAKRYVDEIVKMLMGQGLPDKSLLLDTNARRSSGI